MIWNLQKDVSRLCTHKLHNLFLHYLGRSTIMRARSSFYIVSIWDNRLDLDPPTPLHTHTQKLTDLQTSRKFVSLNIQSAWCLFVDLSLSTDFIICFNEHL